MTNKTSVEDGELDGLLSAGGFSKGTSDYERIMNLIAADKRKAVESEKQRLYDIIAGGMPKKDDRVDDFRWSYDIRNSAARNNETIDQFKTLIDKAFGKEMEGN